MKDAESVKNVAEIIRLFPGEPLVVVISAMGKTTNGLEKVVKAYCNNTGEATSLLQEVKAYQDTNVETLIPYSKAPVKGK